jgi:hypothetical protein
VFAATPDLDEVDAASSTRVELAAASKTA